MQRIRDEIRDHPRASALFLVYWLAVYGLYLSRWSAPKDTPDLARPVLELHILLPLFAGALFSWWRRNRPGRITGAMVAGAAILAIDITLVLAYGLILNRFWESSSWKVIMERKGEFFIGYVAFVIAAGVIGSVLGLVGAAGTMGLRLVLRDNPRPGGDGRASRAASQGTE